VTRTSDRLHTAAARMAAALDATDRPTEADLLRALSARLRIVEDERDHARRMLGECFVLSGADPDGDGWEHNWHRAVEEVRILREECDAMLAQLGVEEACRG
jgi:hypothetical protein